MANIYAASSWRNEEQPEIVSQLRLKGHQVYDFKHPAPGDNGFHWSQIDENWKSWSPAQFREALNHPVAKAGYRKDKAALDWCNSTLLILKSGLSAHMEAAWAAGRGKPTCLYMPDLKEPELMYKLIEDSACSLVGVHWLCLTLDEVFTFFHELDKSWGVHH